MTNLLSNTRVIEGSPFCRVDEIEVDWAGCSNRRSLGQELVVAVAQKSNQGKAGKFDCLQSLD
jgi:hypothetical protein